jgi:catechol 2,3-dioxygenase-like lactoylglutathione lyase family enzyme
MNLTFDVVGLVVKDMARTLGFYRRLGLDIPEEADSTPHVEFELPGGIRLTWDTEDVIASFDPAFEPGRVGNTALAFLADDAAGVDAAYADLVQAGYHGHLAPWDAIWGQRYAVLHDPDGQVIDLFAPLPG